MTDNSAGHLIDGLGDVAIAQPEIPIAWLNQLALADQQAELDRQLLGARQHIRQLQLLLDAQADRLERHRGTDERIAALADFAEWASESRYAGPPASVLVADLRRAVALEPFGFGSAH